MQQIFVISIEGSTFGILDVEANSVTARWDAANVVDIYRIFWWFKKQDNIVRQEVDESWEDCSRPQHIGAISICRHQRKSRLREHMRCRFH